MAVLKRREAKRAQDLKRVGDPKRKETVKKANRKYYQTDGGKESKRKYAQTDGGKESKRKYAQTDGGKVLEKI